MNGQARNRLPRIAIFGYKTLNKLIYSVVSDFEGRADIEVKDLVLNDALMMGHEIEQNHKFDVIITAGVNFSILSSALKIPVVAIKISGYDLLIALLKASQVSKKIGLIIHREKIQEIEEIKNLLNIEISQRSYQTIEEITSCFMSLKEDGYNVIVGSSLIIDLAESSGITGILAYSTLSVRGAIEDAIQIGKISVLESSRYGSLNAVLRHLHEAVLAVDTNHCVTAINPLMGSIIEVNIPAAMGAYLPDIAPQLSLETVLSQGEQIINSLIQLGHKNYLINQIPIYEGGCLAGAIITLQDTQDIQIADSTIRSQKKIRSLSARYQFSNLIGSSPLFCRAIASAKRYAKTSSTILITGESGTGKELFAQAIHNFSSRANSPFVAINCAAFPESLLESELFGHDEGAFTGSRKGGKLGLLEAAHTGTVFLDEIGDMPLTLQTRLLRVLQEREITRIGSVKAIPIDIRIIAATHRHLPEQIENKLFRADLYYRLNILCFRLPRLSERKEDIPILGLHLLFSNLRSLGSSIPADQALGPLLPLLCKYDWPGNVRQLENVIERFAVFLTQYSDVKNIDYQSFYAEVPELNMPQDADEKRNLVCSKNESVEINQEMILQALKQAKGNKTHAAEILGISRSTFWRKLK